jgi:hypothetical protein
MFKGFSGTFHRAAVNNHQSFCGPGRFDHARYVGADTGKAKKGAHPFLCKMHRNLVGDLSAV